MNKTMLLLVLATAGCGEVPAELKIAATIQQFQKSADDFTTTRREIVKQRQALINDTEEATAHLQAATDETIATWRIANDKERLGLYDALATANKAAGDTVVKLDDLRAAHAAALAAADTKVNVNKEKLTAAAKALTALGSKKDVTELVKFYAGFLKETKDDIDQLQKQTATAPDKAKQTVAAARAK